MPSLPFHRTHRCFLWCLAALGFLMSGCQSGDIDKSLNPLVRIIAFFTFIELTLPVILVFLSIIFVVVVGYRQTTYQAHPVESIAPPMEHHLSVEMSLLQKGVQEYKKKNLAAAKAIFLALTQEFPLFADGHFYLAAALEKDGVLKEAFACYRKAVDLQPSQRNQLEVNRLQDILESRGLNERAGRPDT